MSPKKGATILMAITSSNLTTGKRRKFPIKHIYYFPPHLKYVAALPWVI